MRVLLPLSWPGSSFRHAAAPAWGGRLWFGGSETAVRGGGYLEGALNTAARLRRTGSLRVTMPRSWYAARIADGRIYAASQGGPGDEKQRIVAIDTDPVKLEMARGFGATDTVNSGSAPVAPSTATTSFDVLNTLASTPAIGDWVVVDNQNPGDVYAGSNRSAITAVSTPAATLGKHRLGINAMQFPLGYDGGRFDVVSDATQAVFYVCAGASSTLDAGGNAPGVLYRLKAYGFNAAMPATCPSTVGADVVATAVRSCRFLYSANQGATQQSGFISLQVELTRRNETASLVLGAHVSNVP